MVRSSFNLTLGFYQNPYFPTLSPGEQDGVYSSVEGGPGGIQFQRKQDHDILEATDLAGNKHFSYPFPAVH